MKSMHVLHVVGARPNFMKAAPVLSALGRRGVQQTLVHTGQHYDANMSDVFFRELELPPPDVNLEVGSGSHAMQTAQIMMRFEPILLKSRPDWVLVYGDVNSTIAAALVCAKLLVPVAHVEAGLRSGDRTMPEEVNRVLTDQLADLLFTPSADGDENLSSEGIRPDRICRVGNVMIDTLVRLLPEAEVRWPRWQKEYKLERYVLVTLHRPSNVDDPSALGRLLNVLGDIGKKIQILFPIHPRTQRRIAEEGLSVPPHLRTTDPLGYLDFLALLRNAAAVVTDSGGIQEESTYLGVPCLTLRENTERPITVTMGTNTILGRDLQRLQEEVGRILEGNGKRGSRPPLWDGCAAERIRNRLLAG
jgi:UDP-N-acetylglucosamine 2-epimerase (non-hydrolysing)